MQRNVYLQGDLANRFGDKFTVNTDNYSDIFKCIQVNRPEFIPYLHKCDKEDIGFIVETAGESIDEEGLLLPLKEGDITISVVPAGSKSGFAKILAAVAIFVILGPMAGEAFKVLATGAGSMSTAAAYGVVTGLSIGVNLALTGIQQLMAPDPAVDQDAPTNYLFSGGTGTVVEGDPIPILYGELRVPGRPIAVDTRQGYSTTNNTRYGSGGGTYNSDGGKMVHK